MSRFQGIVARAQLQWAQDTLSQETYLNDMWRMRIREEGDLNMTRRARFYGHRAWVFSIKPFFEKWLGVK